MVVAAWGILEWSFAIALIVLVGAAALFGVYAGIQLFRNPGARGSSRRSRRPAGAERDMGILPVPRLYGAGGMTVATALADALGYRFADREIVDQAAARVGLDGDLADHLDERVPALVEKVGLALAAAIPEFGLVSPPAADDRL